MPALRLVALAVVPPVGVQLYESVPVPPVAATLADPVAVPQLVLTEVEETVIAVGSFSVTVCVWIQPLASFTVQV